jgi:hypothetical protein
LLRSAGAAHLRLNVPVVAGVAVPVLVSPVVVDWEPESGDSPPPPPHALNIKDTNKAPILNDLLITNRLPQNTKQAIHKHLLKVISNYYASDRKLKYCQENQLVSINRRVQ